MAGARLSSPAGNDRGSATLEFALVAPVFLFVLMAAMEMGILFWVNLSMQHAVREGARYAVTGQKNLDQSQDGAQRYRAVLQAIQDASMGLYRKVAPVISVGINGGTLQSYGSASLYGGAMFGGPGDVVVLRLDCTWPILTPLMQPFFEGGKYRFSVAATMRNEAF
ncbi:MAG TPA: TadE/TadG family type IV pilus assembly protein [Rhodocyclaceae bacterium]|nr:TadE/TadG family type IV pilus assembly protein [Rhodocyclaceae bacterium]